MRDRKKEIFAPYVEVDEALPVHGDEIVFRDEQHEAIDRAYKHLASPGANRKFLWNAKMRFGKTICALELVRRLDVKTTLIVTHRPVVDEGWQKDFDKVFSAARLASLKEDLLAADKTYAYGSRSLEKEEGLGFSELTDLASKKDGYGIYFVSTQYLALSDAVGGKNAEQQKRDILEFPWDMVIVDEAHEGTQTDRGQNMLALLAKPKTKMLYLSGTPFNLYDDFSDDELYTWDYVMEQRAKTGWDPAKGPNPYRALPRLNIFTYNLGRLVVGEGASFTLAEFFRTKSGSKLPASEQGKFVHEDWVKVFLDKLCEDSATSNYPFSTDEYRLAFNHTLWVLPGVKEAKALEELLRQHEIFRHFSIVNVAGNSDADEARETALDELRRKITHRGRTTQTITLSCGRLTTGVTVPEWSAVFYLKGSENTSAATYMQTVFRTQSPYEFEEDGVRKYKQNCYVFDFAPDRSLRMIAETAKFSTLTQKQKRNAKNVGSHDEDVRKMEDFLKFCPVISLDGTMEDFDAERLFTQLNQVYIDRVVRNGFNDNSLYDVQALLELDADNLNALGDKIAKSSNLEAPPKAKPLPTDVQVASNGLNGKGRSEQPTGDDDQRTDENDAEKKRKKARREERERRIKIIRGIALRVPLMMFGAKVTSDSEEITRENFTQRIELRDWEEFMPRGVTKEDFNRIRRAFNQTIFTGAGKKIRQLAREADDMTVIERIERIAYIFGTFHNPDKETVLTPWRVVNRHLSDTIGGYCFFNADFTGPNQVPRYLTDGALIEYVDTSEPRFIERPGVTDRVFFDRDEGSFDLRSKILEINSKTGLYPLYVAYTLFRARQADYEKLGLIEDAARYSVAEEHAIWDDVLLDNVYVVCNTEMAARITRRTLVGFRDVGDERVNIQSIELVEAATTDREKLIKDLKRPSFWHEGAKGGEMKFSAVVGNPPYQVLDGGNSASSLPIYQHFADAAIGLNPGCISLIMPSRWLSGGRGLGEFRLKLLKDDRISVFHDFLNGTDCFPNVEIKGGICYFLWDANRHGKCSLYTHKDDGVELSLRYLFDEGLGGFARSSTQASILAKVKELSENSITTIIKAGRYFGFHTKVEWNEECDGTLQTANGKSGFPVRKSPTGNFTVKVYVHGGVCWIERKNVVRNQNAIDQYKVLLPRSGNPGSIIIGKPRISEPGSCSSNTYSVVVLSSHSAALNFVSYCKTKFFRMLVASKSFTQMLSPDAYQFVPMQDFSKPWTDAELYAKYNLTAEEIAFIESMIKPMA